MRVKPRDPLCARCRKRPKVFVMKQNGRTYSQSYCKPCRKLVTSAYAKKHRKEYSAKVLIRIERNIRLVESHKTGKKCMDCRKTYPHFVLDFDHRPGTKKHLGLSLMARKGFAESTILAEIAKCDLVCANCHRERTFLRRRGRKLEATSV